MTENELRTKSNMYNQITHEKQFIHELYNCAENRPIIMEAFKKGRAKDLTGAKDHKGKKCLIVGSGPSLDEVLPLLKDWHGGIICTTSHATTLLYHGVVPDYILALDPFARWHEIDGIDWSKYKTALITCPTVWPTLIKNWPNELIMYTQNQGGQNTFYSNELSKLYSDRVNIEGAGERDFEFRPKIKTQMTLFSCSPPAQLFAAQCLGYEDNYLVGCDFAYNTEKTRFTAWFKYSGEWEKKESKYTPAEKKTKEEASNATERDIITNNGLLATSQMLFYKKNMFSAIRLSMQNVIVVGKGAITELTTITAKDLIRKQDFKAPRMKPSEYKRALEKYLASVGGFVIVCKTADNKPGYTFLEAVCPEVDIPEYMAQMKSSYKCGNCGCEAKANDYQPPVEQIAKIKPLYDGVPLAQEIGQYLLEAKQAVQDQLRKIKDHTGDDCPHCEKGKMKPTIIIDIESNMNRIRSLLK